MESAPAKALTSSFNEFEQSQNHREEGVVTSTAVNRGGLKGGGSKTQRVITSDGAGGVGTKNGGIDNSSSVQKTSLSEPRLPAIQDLEILSVEARLRLNQISTLTAINGAALEICLLPRDRSCHYHRCHAAKKGK